MFLLPLFVCIVSCWIILPRLYLSEVDDSMVAGDAIALWCIVAMCAGGIAWFGW